MFITVVLIMILVIIRWPLLSGHHIFWQVKWHTEKRCHLMQHRLRHLLYSDDLFVLCLVDHVSEGVQGYAQLIQKVKLISEL